MEKLMEILSNVLKMVAPSLKKEDSKVGITESIEAIRALNVVSLLLLKRFRDGVDVDDFVAIWDKLKNDEEFKSVLEAGFDKYSEIPGEVKDIDLGEGLELLNVQIEYLPAILEAFKKEEKAPAAE